MRVPGTLRSWNDDRGFGFIAPTQGGREIFVHASAFPRSGSRPTIGEKVTFEVGMNDAGKLQAIDVLREALVAPSIRRPPTRSGRPQTRSLLGAVVAVTLAVGLAAYGYAEYSKRAGHVGAPAQGALTQTPAAEGASPRAVDTRCDGRTYCSQMTSCAEAKFFLKNCPGTKMDGDGDGVPCEKQWCTGLFAN